MENNHLPLVKKKILMKLMCSEALRYKDASLDDVPNDLYNYHLQHLTKQGYVAKTGNLYSLTVKGKQLIEATRPLSPEGGTPDLFRVGVLIILARESRGQLCILNQTRKRQPYYDDKGIIGGPVQHAEHIEDAYKRVLTEETGLSANCTTIGIIRKIRFTPTGKLFSDIFYHVGFAQEYEGTLHATTVHGDNYWASHKVALQNEARSVQGGASIVQVLQQIKSRQNMPFFYYQEHMQVEP